MADVVNLPGVEPSLTLEQKRAILRNARADLEWQIEFAEYQAELAFHKFRALTAKGFTEEQALKLLQGSV